MNLAQAKSDISDSQLYKLPFAQISMEDYTQLLEKAFKEIKSNTNTGERFEMPKVAGQVSGKNTLITNIDEIAKNLRRPIDHIAKFLIRELATPGRIEGERLILQSKLHSSKVNEKLEEYTLRFVICPECKKPDTEIISEKGIKYKHCLACGAKSPAKS